MESLIFILPILFMIVIVLFVPMIRKTKEADRLAKVNYELTNQVNRLKIKIANLRTKKPFFAVPPPEILYQTLRCESPML